MWQGNSLSYIAYSVAKNVHGREVRLKTEGWLASSATVLGDLFISLQRSSAMEFPNASGSPYTTHF